MKILLTLCCLLLATPAWSAYYIRDGASGSTCADWGSNACDQFPSLTAGATYYVADGSYSLSTITAANVTIKKCPSSALKTDTCQSVSGWNNIYGDGQATFGDLTLNTSGFTIDGQVRNESNWKTWTAYGISLRGVRAHSLNNPATDPCLADDEMFRYVAVGANTTSYASSTQSEAFYPVGYGTGSKACQNWTISHSLIQSTVLVVQCTGCTGLLYEYNYAYNCWGKEAIRGQVAANNNIVRWSVFENTCLTEPATTDRCTAEIAAWDGSAGTMDNWSIYGNVFFRYGSYTENSNGVIRIGDSAWGGPIGPTTSNSAAYNNTIAGIIVAAGDSYVSLDGGSGNIARNNLGYDSNATATFSANTVSNNVYTTSNPFVDYAGGDFHLTSAGATALAAGYSLSSPYNTDLDGTTRGGDGKWDVGAYEYPPGGGTPTPPTGTITLSVRSILWWIVLPIGAFAGLITMVSGLLGILARRTFDGRSDRLGGVGDVGGGQVRPPVRPAAAGVVQAERADQPGGTPLEEPGVVADEPARLAAASRSAVMR